MKFVEAYTIALKAHLGQKRWNGDSYITHPKRVSYQFEDEDLKIIAVLHDVIEDTDETIESLIEKGVPEKLVIVVDVLSKRVEESYFDYIMRCKKSETATLVKIEDIKDNLRDLKKGSMKDKYELSIYILEGGVKV